MKSMSLCGQEVARVEERQYLMFTASISMFSEPVWPSGKALGW